VSNDTQDLASCGGHGSSSNIAYSVTLDSSSDGKSYLFGFNLTTGVETKVPTSQRYQLAKQ
jgi:hypothetical protein